MTRIKLDNQKVYDKLKVMSNHFRFKILELTQTNSKSISKLSSALNLSYTKCADYIRMLEKTELVEKIKSGKEILVKSKVKIGSKQITF